MANDKDFLLKNAVEVGGPTKVTLGTVTSNNIDLATGNYFADTPSGASTYTISNAGDVQSFQLEVTGGTEEVAQNFSTTLYAGNGSTQTITNGIDLAGEGGAVWFKKRSGNEDHNIYDTERGVLKRIKPNTTDAENSQSNGLTAFNSNGWTMGSSGNMNQSGYDYASWTFKKEPSFFDVVTYTGDGTSSRAISHNLGCEVGAIFVKSTSATGSWAAYHKETGAGSLFLNLTNAHNQYDTTVFNTAATSTEFTVGNSGNVNDSGTTYVAYLFAHDDAADGLIQCGSFTTDGSGAATVNDIGWQPQWLLMKSSTASVDDWEVLDTTRGWSTSGGAKLAPNTSNQEYPTYYGANQAYPTQQGFTNTALYSNQTYIYIAIRAASDLDITWPSSIEWAGGIAPSAPATGETDVFTLSTDDGGTSYVGVKTADNLS